MSKEYRKHPFRLLARMVNLLFSKANRTNDFVQKSYDRISAGYDDVWTEHMQDLSQQLIDRMQIKQGDKALDLTCGTGYVTKLIADRSGGEVIGVDISEGMLKQAKRNCGENCELVNSDILEYLKYVPDNSFDIVTCCWGLGYTKPLAVLKKIKRVLKPDGKVGIIDNSIYSLIEVAYCTLLVFLEQPEKLVTLMRPKFLPRSFYLGLWWRLIGIKPIELWSGKRSYTVDNGKEAVQKLRATGAAAGFEYSVDEKDQQQVFDRLAEIIEKKLVKDGKIAITHRYLGGVAVK